MQTDVKRLLLYFQISPFSALHTVNNGNGNQILIHK